MVCVGGGEKINWVNLVVVMHFTDVFSGKVGDSRERLMITWHVGLVPVVSSGYSIQDSGVTFCGRGGKGYKARFLSQA